MAIQFECPSCGRQLKAPDEMAGRRGKCPHCQGPIQVPEAVSQAEDVPVAEEVPDQRAYALASPPEPGPEENRRPCPACGELIMNTAVKCRFCGEIFDPTLRRARKKRRRSHSDEDTDLTGGDWVLCVLCSGIACILGIVYAIQGKPKGGKMIAISLLFSLIWGAVRVAIEAALQPPGRFR